jgi:hypothetical protein
MFIFRGSNFCRVLRRLAPVPLESIQRHGTLKFTCLRTPPPARARPIQTNGGSLSRAG